MTDLLRSSTLMPLQKPPHTTLTIGTANRHARLRDARILCFGFLGGKWVWRQRKWLNFCSYMAKEQEFMDLGAFSISCLN